MTIYSRNRGAMSRKTQRNNNFLFFSFSPNRDWNHRPLNWVTKVTHLSTLLLCLYQGRINKSDIPTKLGRESPCFCVFINEDISTLNKKHNLHKICIFDKSLATKKQQKNGQKQFGKSQSLG